MAESKKLGEARTEAGLTQEELAAQAGVAWITIAKLEGGDHHPNLDTLHKLAVVLGDGVYTLRYGWRRKPGGKRGRPITRRAPEAEEIHLAEPETVHNTEDQRA